MELDCFYLGSVTGGSGVVWQYTAIDLASGYAWAELRISERAPRTRHLREFVQRVGRDLRAAGWRLESVVSDNLPVGGRPFSDELEPLEARRRRGDGGPPASDGHVGRLHQRILDECWRPSLARSRKLAISALQRDLHDYLRTYNRSRAWIGDRARGRLPGDVLDTTGGPASIGAQTVAGANGAEPERLAEHEQDGSGEMFDDKRPGRP